MEKDFDYDKELEKFCKSRGIWDSKKKQPTRFVINKLKTIEVTDPNGNTHKQNVFDGFTTKKPRFKYCHYCAWDMVSRGGKKYCCDSCRDNARRIRERLKDFSKIGANAIIIPKNPEGKPRWKDCTVTFVSERGGYHAQPLTNKNGKPRRLGEFRLRF